MRFPDLLIQFAELERRQRMLDADLQYIRKQLVRIEGAKAYIGPEVSRETAEPDGDAQQPTLFDAEQ